MDLKALGETLVAVGLTPVISLGMALVVVAGIIAVSRRLYRR
jgi:hypothetical protein